MPRLRLIAKIQNVLPFRTTKSTEQRKFAFAASEELAEHNDFGGILKVASVSDTSIPEPVPRKWSEGLKFDASKFGDVAYKKYEEDSFSK